MTSRRKSSGLRTQPKVFKCTGYGDCNMVFTRSEHLLRHERKHTGEKPYECVVPGCDRRFSRFDNMMQHTQTHNKGRKKTTIHKDMSQCYERDNEGDRPRSLSLSMVESRTLPFPSRMSPSSSTHKRYSWPMRNDLSYSSHPYNDEGLDYWNRRSSTASTVSSDSTIVSPVSNIFPHREPEIFRRLSVHDLQLPIESFNDLQIDEKPDQDTLKTVNITSDEFEALQALGKIRSVTSPTTSVTSSPKSDYKSPNFASQVCAMRQRVMTFNESYQRC